MDKLTLARTRKSVDYKEIDSLNKRLAYVGDILERSQTECSKNPYISRYIKYGFVTTESEKENLQRLCSENPVAQYLTADLQKYLYPDYKTVV